MVVGVCPSFTALASLTRIPTERTNHLESQRRWHLKAKKTDPPGGHPVKELNLLSFYTATGTRDSQCASLLSVPPAQGGPDGGKPQAGRGAGGEGSVKANAGMGHKQGSGDQERVEDHWGSRDSDTREPRALHSRRRWRKGARSCSGVPWPPAACGHIFILAANMATWHSPWTLTMELLEAPPTSYLYRPPSCGVVPVMTSRAWQPSWLS